MDRQIAMLHGRVITGMADPLFYEDGYIRIHGDTIVEIGPIAEYRPQAGECTEDLRGRMVAPGMISTHCHFYGQFARGMPLSRPMANWQQVLSRMWWELDRALDEEALYYSAVMGLIEGLKSGTTTYFDHNASPNWIDGSLDVIRKAVEEAGARAVLAYEVTDRNGKEGALAGIRENERMIRRCQREGDDRFQALLGLHASYTLEEDTLERCRAVQQDLQVGCHIHMAEAAADVSDCYRRFDTHVVDRLAGWGLLDDKSITAHTVHVGSEQWEVMKQLGITAAHNVQSNTNNAVGICPVCDMLDHGVHVAVGGDGYTYDLFTELGFASIVQRLAAHSPAAFSQAHLLALGFGNPRRLMQKTFGYDCGVLSPGAKADLIVLSYDPPTPVTAGNALSHLLAGAPGHVDTVLVGGQTVVKEGRCTLLDEERLLARCREAAGRLWSRLP